jgi:hypothetical protein
VSATPRTGPPPLIEGFGAYELGQTVLQRGLVHGCERVQEFIGKLPAQHGAELRYLTHRRQPIQAGHERIVQGGGKVTAASRPVRA